MSLLTRTDATRIREAARCDADRAARSWLPRGRSAELDDVHRDALELVLSTRPGGIRNATLRRLTRVRGREVATRRFVENEPQEDREGFVWGYRDVEYTDVRKTRCDEIQLRAWAELQRRNRLTRALPWYRRWKPQGDGGPALTILLMTLLLCVLGYLARR